MKDDKVLEFRTLPNFPRFAADSDGFIWVIEAGKTRKRGVPYRVKTREHEFGYKKVALRTGKVAKSYYVHRLVCEAFHGPAPPDKPQTAHLDGNPKNNKPTNLKWKSSLENHQDKWLHGTMPVGNTHHNRKLSLDKVLVIKEKLAAGLQSGEIAKEFNVGRSTIRAIADGRTWLEQQKETNDKNRKKSQKTNARRQTQ